MTRRLLIVSLLLCTPPLLTAAEKTGAELVKEPVAVEIVERGARHREGTKIGDVRVTYADKTKDLWTTKGNCSLPAVAPDGLVGWTVNEPETAVAASYTLRPNATLVLCRRGKIVGRIVSSLAFIEEWSFLEKGARVVLLTRASHGPARIELHDAVGGKLLQTVSASDPDLPAWARRYREQ